MSVVKTFHDGVSIKSEVEERLGGEKLFRVDPLLSVRAARRSVCEERSWLCAVCHSSAPGSSCLSFKVRPGTFMIHALVKTVLQSPGLKSLIIFL